MLFTGCSRHLPACWSPAQWRAPLCDIHRSARATQPHRHCLCQQPRSRTCSQDGRRAVWVSKCYHRPLPFSSVTAGRPLCHGTGLAENLLLTADTFGLTVNNKTKSLCTAIQPLLHLPGYQWPGVTVTQGSCTTVSGRQMCSTLCAQSPCWQHQLPSDNKPQWQGKEKSVLRRNRNKIMPLSNHI